MSVDSKQYDYAQAQAGQLVTLATGVITITLTFYKNFTPSDGVVPAFPRWLLIGGWICLAVSLLIGVVVYGTITGRYKEAIDNSVKDPPIGDADGISASNISVPLQVQYCLFLLGFGAVLVGGIIVVA